ncbi:MAG TPA: hypothetical protein VEU94_02270 [Terriglobales bacterium]|nr:hypothetical protein [Terriglobales bacterium]
MGKEPDQECGSLEAAIHLRSVALAYIHENRRILELLKTGVVTEEHNESFDVALGCLSDLEIVSRDIQQALALLPDLS